MSIIIIVSATAALLNDTIRTEGPLVAVDTRFEDEIRRELDEDKYVILTTSFINQKDAGKEIN